VNGSVQSIKSFTLPGNVASSGELKTRSDGGYFFNGYDLTYSSGFISDYRQVVIYLDGALNAEKAIRLSHASIKNQDLTDLIPLEDGGFISSSGGSRNTDDAHFYRVNKDGNIIWRRKIGGAGGQQLTSSSFLEDSTIIFAGNTTTSSGGNNKDILWLRTRIGSNATACGVQESDVVSEIISIANLSFSFGSITDLSSNLWVTINPAIQEDVHVEKYNCQPDCKEPTCGLIVKNFDIGGNERVWSTSTSPDNYVYLVGGTERDGGVQASFILKTDSAGLPLWSRAIPGNGQQFFTKVLATKDSGAIAVGISRTYPSSVSGSAIVVKWDKNGVRKWSRSYRTNSPNYDIGLAIIETSDGGYLLTGTHNSAGFVAKGFVMKIDINGVAEWIKHYHYNEGSDMMGILETEDAFLISGDYLYNSNTTYGVFILKIRKSDGEILQTKSWVMPDRSIIIHCFLHKAKDGFYLACSQMLAQIPNYFNNMRQTVLHLDNSLNLIRTTRISHNEVKNGLVADIAGLSDGSFLGAAGGDKEGDDVDIYKVSPNGVIQWRTRVGGIGGQNIWSMTATEDSSYVFGGITTASGNKDILWLKVPIGKSIEGCDVLDSDAISNLISVDQSSFSYSEVTNGNLNNWVIINPAIESDGFQLTYSCGVLCAPGDVLPLKIINFSGSRTENNKISIFFETMNELNVGTLTIEYSLNPTSFNSLDELSSKGGVYNQYHYSTEKLNSKTGDLYFRIKVKDLDGREYYSNTLVLKSERQVNNVFKVFPNPSNGLFNISFYSSKISSAKIKILDNSGRIVYYRIAQVLHGDNSILSGNGKKLNAGIYYVTLEEDGVLFSEKVIVY
jgi:hypothetical protein